MLTSTILRAERGRSVPDMELGRLRIPVLVVHHAQDGCHACPYADIPGLLDRLAHVPRKDLLTFTGGQNRGDPCEAFAHHGFNGLEREVVERVAGWIVSR